MPEADRCASWDDLADWWVGDLAPSRADGLEEHLLACETCARRAERTVELARALGEAVRSGAVGVISTPALLDKLERDGVRVRRYRIAPGQVVPCSVWPEDEVMATVLDVSAALAVEGTSRLDLVARFGGEAPFRQEDVPIDHASGTLTWLTPASSGRNLPSTRISLQVVRVTGRDEVIAGEYALAHEPWTGPASPR